MKKRILSIVLSIVMLVGLLPTTALAADTYTIYIAGLAMTASADGSAVSYYVNGVEGAAGTVTDTGPQSGWNAKLSYDTAEQTLVLEADGLVAPSTTVDGWTDGYGNCYGAIYSPDAPLKIVLKNNPSTIGSSGSNSGSGHGIYSAMALTIDIEVSGNNVTAPGKSTKNSGSWGIRGGGNIVINSSDPSYTLEVSASGGSCGYTYGIFSNGSITFNGGTVRATGGSGSSGNDVGISAKGITVNSGATVYGTGGSNGLRSYGFELGGFKTMEVNDGAAVYATGGTGGSSSAGIDLSGNLVINGGIFEAKGQSSTGGSYGVTRTSMASFTINGGQVTLSASGGATNNRACDSVTPTLPTSSYGWKISADGDLTLSSDTPYTYDKAHTYLYVETLHAHPVCGATHTDIGDHISDCKEVEWQPLSSLLGEPDEDGMYPGATINTNGNYYLDKDIEIKDNQSLTIFSDVSLCLNGHTIKITNSYGAFYVGSGATLNICDCSTNQSGKIENTSASPDYAGIFNTGGTVNVYSGTVSSSNNSNGIFNNGGTVNVYSGTVSSSKRYGINNNSGTVNVYSGTVSSSSTYGINNVNGTLNLSGAPVITGTMADIHLVNNKVINISSALTYGAANAISVKMELPGIFTSGWTTNMGSAADNYGSYFTSANDGYTVQPDGSGELKLAVPITYTVTYNGNGATSGDVPADSNSPYISGSTVTVLGNTGALAKTGYAFVGWNTLSSGYGTDYAPGATFNINSNTTLYAQWEEYEITSQPTESTPAVGTNADGDIASYQWYKGTMSEVTDTADGVSAYTEDTLTSSYSDGWWTCHGTGETTPGYFTIALNAGDSILAQTSDIINYAQLGIWAAYEKQDWDWTTPDDHFLVTAPADGNYDLHVSDVTYGGGTQPTVKAQVFHIGSTPADGATSKTLVANEDGWYACKITYKDGTVLYSGPVEYEAPSIPVTGVKLSESSLTLDVGDTAELTATISPNNATDKTVSWTSSDPTVAKVENGVVTALKPGSTTITATANDGSGKSATCSVTVNKIAITGPIAITTTKEPTVGQEFSLYYIVIPDGNYRTMGRGFSPQLSIEAGKDYTLSVELKPNDGYYFANGVAATVNGKAATVVRSGDNISIKYTYSFASPAANSVDILQYEIPVTTVPIVLPGIEQADVVLPFTAKVLDQYGQEMTGQTVEWSITGTNTTGISVNNGTVTVAKDAAVGNYTLTATCGGKSDSITIKVEKAESVLTTVKIFDGGGSGNEITTIDRTIPDVGYTLYINSVAKGYDQYGEVMTGLTFTWSNTNTDSEISLINGYVTIKSGAKEGSFSYTASCNGKSSTVTVNLTKKIYTVTYTDNVAGETIFADTPVTVQSGGTAPAYPNATPTRSGYVFAGWYTSTDGGATLSASAYDFDTPVTGNLTLYAKWTEKATVSINDAVQTYTWSGSVKSFAITGTPNTGFTVQYKVNGNWTTTAPSAVGAYDVRITRAEDDTYKAYEKIITGGLVINAATPTATAPTAKTGLVYDGNAKSLINAGTSEHGYWEYSLDGTSYSSDIPTGIDAKTYTVYCRFVPNTGYGNISPVQLSVTIAPLAVDEPTVSGSYTYTGSEQTVALDGFNSSYMTITGGNKGTYADDYEVSITLDSNHTWKSGSDGRVQWSIEPATPNVTWPIATAYVNDASVTLTGGSATGVDGNALEGTFVRTDSADILSSAGEKTISVTFTPNDSTNYKSVNGTSTVTVSKRTVESVAAQAPITNVVYGTEQNALGLPATVEITVSGNKKFTVPVEWSGYDATNLNAQTLTGTLDLSAIEAEVQQADLAITASIVVDLQEKNAATFNYENKTETYNGSSISHEISGTLEGVASISYSYVGSEYAASSTAPTNAGVYEVTATFTMQPGYAAVAPKTATLTINPKEVGLDWSELTGEELVYSGTAKALTATATGLADGDSCTVTVEFVGDNVNVGTFSYKATVLSNANYKLPADVSSPEYTITPKTLTITADSHEVYVGSRQPELTYTIDGLVGTDTLTTAPTLSTDANMYRAGTYAITFASEAAAGNNYSITYVNGTLTVKNYPYIPQPTYDVEIADDITGGDVSASKKLAYRGDTITITVVPDAGYEITKLTVTDSCGNAVSVTKVNDSKYTFKMPGYDVEIDAVFAKIDTTCPRDWTCPMYGYTDLDRTLWYHDGIHYCIEHGLMVGTGTNIFEPNIATSRAMIVTIFWRLEGSPIVNYAMDFEDVAADQWYTEAIRWAASEKIVEGYGNGQFGTNDAITREQMVTIMFRYARYKGYDVSVGENTNILSYDDAFDVAEWAIPAMQWACGSGMIQGIADGNQMNLAPQGNATRAQAAAILQRFCENVAKEK